MKSILTPLFSIISLLSFAQKNVMLTIQHKLGTTDFTLNEQATSPMGNNFKLSRVDYYMSGFTLIHDGGQETAIQPGVYVLVKAPQISVQLLGSFNINQLEGIKFHIGIPDSVNHDDITLYPDEHPLSFQAPSMHWGWADGYRFICLEGKAGNSLSTTFEMHGLGDSYYYEQTINTSGELIGNNLYVNLSGNYIESFRTINLDNGPIDHGVGATDLRALENFRDYVFSAAPSTPVGISEPNIPEVKVFPNPSSGNTTITLTEITDYIKIYTADGRLIYEEKLNEKTQIDWQYENKGLYFVELYSNAKRLATTKIVIE